MQVFSEQYKHDHWPSLNLFVTSCSLQHPPSPASLSLTNFSLPPSISLLPLPHSSFPPLISEHPSSSLICLSPLPFSRYPFLSVSLPGVVSVAGVLLFLTATALTSMTFFSCLVRHQTPALGEATLLHRCRAAAKLCTGTARQWSRTVRGRGWERRRRRKGKRGKNLRQGERGAWTIKKLYLHDISCFDYSSKLPHHA